MHENVEEGDLDPEEHLAREWALFQSVEAGASGNLYRCWQAARPVVVVGRNSLVADDVIQVAEQLGLPVADDVIPEKCGADGVRVLRRFSGGGAVVLGPGCLNYAVVLSLVSWPALTDVAASFRFILERIVAALSIPGLSAAGEADLALGGRKVSGNAQRRGRRALIHHGTLLYGFDPQLATRYLKEPARQPAYRAARRHAEFIANLPLSAETIRARVETAWKTFRFEDSGLQDSGLRDSGLQKSGLQFHRGKTYA
jgi:lipoate-protein ligase A